jgi:Rieske Fe-S protein
MSETNSNKVSRRRFLDILLGGSTLTVIAGFFYPMLRFFVPPDRQEEAVVTSVNLGKVDNFKYNSGEIFRFGSKPGLLIRDSDGNFRANFATCTHLDCIVQYDSESENIWCACHNGRYDVNGINISGPPPRPLTQMKVNITPESNEVIVTLADGATA